MPRSEKDVVAEMGDILRASGQKLVTWTWPEFYELNKAKRFAAERHVYLREQGLAQGLIIGIGNYAISATHDSNHSPSDQGRR